MYLIKCHQISTNPINFQQISTNHIKSHLIPPQDLKAMTDRIRIFQILNEQIFATLEKYLRQFELQQMQMFKQGASGGLPTTASLASVAVEQVVEFDPPAAKE